MCSAAVAGGSVHQCIVAIVMTPPSLSTPCTLPQLHDRHNHPSWPDWGETNGRGTFALETFDPAEIIANVDDSPPPTTRRDRTQHLTHVGPVGPVRCAIASFPSYEACDQTSSTRHGTVSCIGVRGVET